MTLKIKRNQSKSQVRENQQESQSKGNQRNIQSHRKQKRQSKIFLTKARVKSEVKGQREPKEEESKPMKTIKRLQKMSKFMRNQLTVKITRKRKEGLNQMNSKGQ